MFILHNKRFDMTSWFGFPEYIFCSKRDIHLFIFFTYLDWVPGMVKCVGPTRCLMRPCWSGWVGLRQNWPMAISGLEYPTTVFAGRWTEVVVVLVIAAAAAAVIAERRRLRLARFNSAMSRLRTAFRERTLASRMKDAVQWKRNGMGWKWKREDGDGGDGLCNSSVGGYGFFPRVAYVRPPKLYQSLTERRKNYDRIQTRFHRTATVRNWHSISLQGGTRQRGTSTAFQFIIVIIKDIFKVA